MTHSLRSRLELDILSILIETTRSGADVHRELCNQYDTPPAKTTVYRALTRLEEDGLVTTYSRDGARMKAHTPTREGAKVIKRYTANLTVRVQTAEFTGGPSDNTP